MSERFDLVVIGIRDGITVGDMLRTELREAVVHG